MRGKSTDPVSVSALGIVQAGDIELAPAHDEVVCEQDANHDADEAPVAVHEGNELGRRVDRQPRHHDPGAQQQTDGGAAADVDPPGLQAHGVVSKRRRVGGDIGRDLCEEPEAADEEG